MTEKAFGRRGPALGACALALVLAGCEERVGDEIVMPRPKASPSVRVAAPQPPPLRTVSVSPHAAVPWEPRQPSNCAPSRC
jgi:hypothetical protein